MIFDISVPHIGRLRLKTLEEFDTLCRSMNLDPKVIEEEVEGKVRWAVNTVVLANAMPETVRPRLRRILNYGIVQVSENLMAEISQALNAVYLPDRKKGGK